MDNREQSLPYWKPYAHATLIVSFHKEDGRVFCTAQLQLQEVNLKISNYSSFVIMSDTESQDKSSSSENKDPVNPENATEHAETSDESAIEHVKKPYDQGDIIPITENDRESPRKKRPWDSEEEKESTMTFKRIRFETIPGEGQNNWKVPDEMAKYAKKYFEKYVSDNELQDSITLNSPVPTNLPKAKNMDDYFAELLEDQRKKKDMALDDTFKKLQPKNTNDYGTP